MTVQDRHRIREAVQLHLGTATTMYRDMDRPF
jgi:hypothetical protein